MQYTIRHKGQVVGTTDLGFRRIPGMRSRMGEFFPTQMGETLMPAVATPSPALLAFMEYRNGNPGVTMENFADSEFYRDAEAAMERSAAIVLTLHAEDGRLIPTEDIGIRDTEVLLAMARETEKEFEEVEELSEQLRADIENDVEIISSMFDEAPWRPEEEPNFPRYQVIVFLENAEDVP